LDKASSQAPSPARASLEPVSHAEGEEVLRLLKRKEYDDFLPGEAKDPLVDKAPQHAYDQKWKERFDAIHDQLAAIGREYSGLIKEDPRTDEENQRLSVLQSDLATAQKALEQLYHDIAMIGSPERASDLQESGETLTCQPLTRERL